ncbi:hypothetical protein ACLB2K_048403 [Fragaria x ananassa]
MRFKAFRWLKALWPARRSSRLHPINDGVTNMRTFISMNSFDIIDRHEDDDLVFGENERVDDGVTNVRTSNTTFSYHITTNDGLVPLSFGENERDDLIISSHVQRMRSECLKAGDCSICLEGFEMSTHRRFTHLPCSHFFHEICISKWCESSSHVGCPLCRQPVLPQGLNLSLAEEHDDDVYGIFDALYDRFGLRKYASVY